MALSTIITGNNGVIKVDDAAGTLTSIASLRSFSIEIASDTIETSTMTTDARTYVKGMSSFSGTAEIFYDGDEFPTAAGSTNMEALNPTLSGTNTVTGASPISIEVFPDLANHANTKWSGNIIITGLTINSSMDGMIEASISFQGSGPLAYANT
tara:strand:+ start:1542 stop:2003 length:462 start_codon:yes stop_codon:yes gene_type:complete